MLFLLFFNGYLASSKALIILIDKLRIHAKFALAHLLGYDEPLLGKACYR